MIVVLGHSDEQYAPPSQPVLRVAVIGPDTFLSIGSWEENGDEVRLPSVAVVAVPTAELRGAVDYLERSQTNREVSA